MSIKAKHARNVTVMLTAKSKPEEAISIARKLNLKPVHFEQLAVPIEEMPARRILIEALKQDGLY